MRAVTIEISAALIVENLKLAAVIGPAICVDGLPDGARIVGVRKGEDLYAGLVECVILTVEHESFAEVAPGQEPPRFTPRFNRLKAFGKMLEALHLARPYLAELPAHVRPLKTLEALDAAVAEAEGRS